jgi:septal ring factor EnvC (AmiA/AmiB activator)
MTKRMTDSLVVTLIAILASVCTVPAGWAARPEGPAEFTSGADGQRERILEQLETLEAKMTRVASKLEEAAREREALEERRHDLEERLEQSRSALQALREKLESRLVALYKFSGMGYLFPLLAAGDLESGIHAVKAMGELLKRDRVLFAALNAEQTSLEALRSELEEKERSRAAVQSRLEEKKAVLEELRNEKIQLLVCLQEEPRLKAGEPGGAVFGERKGRADPEAEPVSFSQRRGQLPLPASGQVFTGKEGKKDSPYYSILYNNGIILRAPAGEPVKAIHPGVVVFAGWFKGYGNLMIIDHGQHYYSLMAHLDRLRKKAGDRVGESEVVGVVGETGSIDGPKLYFEIRHGGRPVDLRDWVNLGKVAKR